MDIDGGAEHDAARRQRFPLGSAVTIERLARDPYPLFRDLRAREPVTWAPALSMWLLTRRDDIVAVLADPDLFTTDSAASTIRDVFGRQMLSSDGPDWIRYKRACMPPFRKEALVGDMRSLIREWVAELVAGFDRRDVADLRSELSVPLSLGAVLRVMGLPAGDSRQIHEWYDDFAEALANFTGDAAVRRRGHDSARAFADYVTPYIEGARRVPPRSLLGHLLREDSRTLTDAEVVSNLLIVLFGGVETADSMISTCLYALLTHPEVRSEARETPARLPVIVDEILRWDAPVQSCTRFATR
ncbi:MAG: cytochrome P450, partial [Gemmatimonadetes bacterium]|nr:cytochrome P450 [Gemmatimonadota bacterium]